MTSPPGSLSITRTKVGRLHTSTQNLVLRTRTDHPDILVILDILPHQVLHVRARRDRLRALRAAGDDEQVIVGLPPLPLAILVPCTAHDLSDVREQQLAERTVRPGRS